MMPEMGFKAKQAYAAKIRGEYDACRRHKTSLIRQDREHRHVSDRMAELSWIYRELTGEGLR